MLNVNVMRATPAIDGKVGYHADHDNEGARTQNGRGNQNPRSKTRA
jgi:hypothetical protein